MEMLLLEVRIVLIPSKFRLLLLLLPVIVNSYSRIEIACLLVFVLNDDLLITFTAVLIDAKDLA